VQRCSPDDPSWLQRAAAVIRGGGVVALPYERLFGLAANALDGDAVARVATIKDRHDRLSGPRPIAVVLPNREGIAAVSTRISPLAEQLADRHWPGPLTILVEARNTLPGPLVSEKGLIGMRLAGPCPAATLAAHLGVPLTATSANRAGAPEALSHRDIEDLEGVALLLEGTVSGPPGSTVVDATGSVPTVLRRGAVSLKEVP
jgi:L-threonylcarbamoyladenylate synthase